MDNRTIDEVRRNEDRLINEIELLEKENRSLKKQLKTVRKKYEFESKNRDKIWKILMKKENQQKAFIEYLENEIKSCELTCDLIFNHNKEMKIYKNILLKYKEIIGGKDE